MTMHAKKYHLPLSRPYQWARGTQTVREGLLVQLRHAGITGWGEVALLPNVMIDADALAAIAQRYIAQLEKIVEKAEDTLALDIPSLCQRLDQLECPPSIRCGMTTAAFAWQAAQRKKTLGQYLHEQYSGKHLSRSTSATPLARIKVNALIASDDVAACVEQATKIVANGQHLIKLKCTTDRHRNLEKLDAIKTRFPQVTFRLDPNQSWSEEWIIEHIREVLPFGIEYVEEPLPSHSHMSFYAHIRRETGVAIALDERIRDASDVINALDLQACDHFVLKLQRLGGIDKFLAITDVLQGQLHRVVLTSNMESALGIAAGLHCASVLGQPEVAHGLATFDFMRLDLCTQPTVQHGGYVAVPTGIGLGMVPDDF